MTVVSPRPLHIRVDVAEKDLYRLARGLQGTATPAGYPEMKLPVAVEHVSPFPIGPVRSTACFASRWTNRRNRSCQAWPAS